MQNNSKPAQVRPKAWLAWSSGKDSAWALHTVRESRDFDVVALLTTVNRTHERVAMHAVRESLLEKQAIETALPLVKVPIPSPCSNQIYEQAMDVAMALARAEGVRHVIFGDLFLEDIRAYREQKLAACGMIPVFPLWGRDTRLLAEQMIAEGLLAYLTCVDPRKLDRKFAGRPFDQELLLETPPMRPGKRMPSLTVERNGNAVIDLWCKSVPARLEFSDNGMKIETPALPDDLPQMQSNGQCTPPRMQADEDMLAALARVTAWHKQGSGLVLVGPKTLKFQPSDH